MLFRSQRGWATELIVCDNNSTDGTAGVAREAGARVVFEPVNQIGRARNTGAANADGDWLVFVDADSYPSDGLFAEVADAIQSGRCLAGGSTIRLDAVSPAVRFGVSLWNSISRINKWAAGSFIFCEAAAFRATGGFSQELYASEEIDLFRRFKQAARQRSLGIVILRRHPLLTSDRKLRLYTWREQLRFVARTVLSGGRTLRNAKECFAWYDGRR